MRQLLRHTSPAAWNCAIVADLAMQPGLSRRADNVYGWIAGILAFMVPWSDMVLLPYEIQFTRPLVVLAILSWLFSWRAGNALRRVGFPILGMTAFVLLVPAHLFTADDPGRIARRV